MTTGKGYDLEAVFRMVFHIDPSTDIVALMEAAIQVVSSTRPKEFSDRMVRTLKGIDAIKKFRAEEGQKKKQNPNESDQCATRPRLKLVIKRSRSDKNAIKIREDDRKDKRHNKSDDVCSAKGGVDDEKKLNLKFENSKRKFQQETDEIRKKKRKIQFLDIKDLPRAPPKLRNKGRVSRLRALAYVQ